MGPDSGIRTGRLSRRACGRLGALAAACALAPHLFAAARAPAPGRPAGVEVESVAPWSAGAKAGLAPGDVLVGWERESVAHPGRSVARGSIRDPFDLALVEIEQAPRGLIRLSGRRGPARLSIAIPPGQWRIDSRPAWTGSDADDWRAGAAELASGSASAAASRWSVLGRRLRQRRDERGEAWVELRTGRALSEAGDPVGAEAAFARALEAGARSADPRLNVEVHERLAASLSRGSNPARTLEVAREAACLREEIDPASLAVTESLRLAGEAATDRGDLALAESLLSRSLTILESTVPDSLSLASSAASLGFVALRRGRFDLVRDVYERAYAIRQSLVPDGALAARSLANLGIEARNRGDLDGAAELARQASVILEREMPDSRELANTLSNYGDTLRQKGDLRGAQPILERALAIRRKAVPGSLDVAISCNSLGLAARARGELSRADDYLQQSVEIRRRISPDSPGLAANLANLAVVASDRGDHESADRLIRQALAIWEKRSPGSIDVARGLVVAATVAWERGDVFESEALQRRALDLFQRVSSDSLEQANVVNNLGLLEEERANFFDARRLYLRALESRQLRAPGGLDVASSLGNLGRLAAAEGDLRSAEEFLVQARFVAANETLGTRELASILSTLGDVRLRQGRRGEARDAYCEAATVIESLGARLGGSDEARAGFTARKAGIFRAWIDVLADLGDVAAAFGALERSRARGLVELLAQRDLDWSTDVPASLAREQRLAGVEHNRLSSELHRISSATPKEERERLENALRDVRVVQKQVDAKIRAASPRLADLQVPKPLAIDELRHALEPGTLFLSFLTGDRQTLLFVVDRDGGADLHRIPAGEAELTRRVARLRRFAESPAATIAAAGDEAKTLSKLLLAPARARIAAATRLLVSSDGPLHFLPFSLLADPGGLDEGRGATWQPILESKPVTVVGSATAWTELARRRKPNVMTSIVAFGDPFYGDDLATSPRLEALPATRREVEALASLAPEVTTTFLGKEATKERARTAGKNASIVHFACHGLIDDRFPLDSALALSVSGGGAAGSGTSPDEEGLLHAWEIFESVRLDADLVTLSACRTALGKEARGEGLLGLTRAFQYAGARSILASLWSVSDDSTVDLMKRFYQALVAGVPKDEALRRAQADLLHGEAGPEGTKPFAWAAFQLSGDWK